jgi:uncharacterized protein YndB with AHSA1/START domain
MIDVTAWLDAEPSAVWRALTDTAAWPAWGPTVAGGIVDGGGRMIGPGATGRVRTAVGISLPFEVTAWEEGRRWAWKVAGVPATGHRVEAVSEGGCQAVMEVPCWAFAYVPVCHIALWRLGRVATKEP